MTQQHIDKAIEALLPNGGAGRVTEHRLRHVLERLAQQAATTGVNEALAGLREASEIEHIWGVSRRRVNAHIRHLHERFGVGAKIGGAWVLTAEEVERYAPGDSGRPRKE